MDELNLSMGEAQKFVDKKRVSKDGIPLTQKSILIEGEIEVVIFEPEPQGLLPCFETNDFAVFEKPSGMLVHPRKRADTKTLNDEIKSLYGKDSNAVHRIDKETSGLVIVGKNKQSEIELKSLFADKKIYKEYIALVHGKVTKTMDIDEKLLVDSPTSLIRLKVHVDKNGKDSFTKIEPLEYDPVNNITLVKAIPLSGRQHQIRVHLFHVEHSIIGDSLYGIDENTAEMYLEGKISEEQREVISGAKRLLLHACRVLFEYKNIKYDIVSNVDIKEEFYNSLYGGKFEKYSI